MGVTIRQKIRGRGNPWWVFITHNKKRTSKLVGDKKAAARVASEIRTRLNLNQYAFEKPHSIPNFKDFAQGYLETYSAMNHKPSTQVAYRIALEKHIYPYFGNMPIDQIKRPLIKKFIQDPELNKKLSAATIRNLKAYISSILSEAVEDELIEANPAAFTGKLIKKTDPAKKIDPLTWDEKNQFEETLRTHYPAYYPFFHTMLRTGMRLGEIIALKPGDLDFVGGFIEVKRNCVRGLIGTPKNGKGRRVDMSKGLAEVLQAYLTRRKREVLRKGWNEPPEWLFYNGSGNVVDVNNLRDRVFKKVLERAGLRHIRMHDLRHTYATLRVDAGHNIADIQKQLGHHSIKITIDTYHHWMPGTSKAEVDELDLDKAPKCTLYAPKQKEGRAA